MKSFVRQHSLSVSDAVVGSGSAGARSGRKNRLQTIIPIKDEEGIIVGYKEGSPTPSPTISRRLQRQNTFDTTTSSDRESLDYDSLSPLESPSLEYRSLPNENSVSYLTTEVQHVQAVTKRKRSQSELTPGMAVTFVVQQVSTVLTDTEDAGHEEFSIKERSNKYRTSLRKVKKISPMNARRSIRKRAKSCAEDARTEDRDHVLPPPSPKGFKRKTSLFRGRNKDTMPRTHSVPDECLDYDNLCVPNEYILERKPSWNSLKEAINSTLKSPRLSRRSTGDESSNRKSFEEFYRLKLEVAKADCPEAFTKFKIIQVQEKFPHDKLDLDLSWQEYERFKCRRYHHQSPGLRNKRSNPPDLGEDKEKKTPSSAEEQELHISPSPSTHLTTKRLYIQEGPVKLSTATSTNERYLFLFNDLLIVAKPKSTSTFKLKERIRVSELWLSNCIDEVTETTITHEKAFVIGWPTTNYVASFNLIEEKDLWYNALQKSINERKENEEPKEITIKVINKTQDDNTQPQQTCQVTVSCKDEAKTVLKSSLEQFQQGNEDPSEYQLMILAKDGSTFPLIGHELPYAIRMNHIRALHEYTHDENDNHYEQSGVLDDDGKLQFIVKKAKKGNTRNNLDIANNKKKWKIKKSPIINWAMNKTTVKPAFNPQDSLPIGKLFRNPLIQLSNDENVIPKPILDMLVQLFRRGPATSGIFRKPASARAAKQIRSLLDEGKDVDFEETSSIVIATVLKEFFRTLPESLIISDQYDNLLAAKSITDSDAKLETIKTILRQFPKCHYETLMRFLCILHHINRFSNRNKMTAYNLAICVSPSIMFLPANTKMVTEQAAGGSDIVCFMIENYIKIFSEENEYCLGEESEIQLDDDRADDSDYGADETIYKYDEEGDEREDSEKETEPITPDFLLSPVDGESVFSQSDSSLNTNDSDELKMKLNIPSIALSAGSKSSPNSPMLTRRKKIEKSLSTDNKLNSDWSDQEGYDSENFQRRLLRQPRPKRMLSSTTTSAELIEHKRQFTDSTASITSGEGVSPSNSFNSLPSSATLVPQRHVMQQPVIHHFATDYRPTPNVIFHAVDRRRQPAAPSYEEHIQRTQSKQRVVKTPTSKRQPVVAHTTVVQHQSSPVAQPKRDRPHDLSLNTSKSSMSESNSQHSISSTSSNEERRSATLSRKPRVNKNEKPIVSPKHTTKLSLEEKFFPKETSKSPGEPIKPRKKMTREENTTLEEFMNNFIESAHATPVENENRNIEDELQQELNKDNTIEDTFNSIMNSLQHNVQLNGNVTDRKSSERRNSGKKRTPPPTAPKPRTSSSSSSDTNTASTTREVIGHEEIQSLNNLLSSLENTATPTDEEGGGVSVEPSDTPRPSQSPFTLNLKTDLKKSPSNATNDEQNKAPSSLALEKKLLTKAPQKIDQLRLNSNERREEQGLNSRPMTAREMRRTNRRLKSEIRNAFNEGKFNTNSNERAESVRHKTLNINNFFNGHLTPDSQMTQQNKENLIAEMLSRQCFPDSIETNNNTLDDYESEEKVESDTAFAKIMSQAESYV
ncbi:rho GTPase-activating protein gacU-like isoform X2 [Clytia hemisphaerica]|uniref:Rho GTPase activating protein n=1 Tax=Clytia hemisphaerica TaxID=252671 RepID=A0A7M5UWD5_9CNID